jgi:hypothetical protein
MTVTEAVAAWEYAEEVGSGCEENEELDHASNFDVLQEDCPSHFSPEQIELAQQILIKYYMRAIGRC